MPFCTEGSRGLSSASPVHPSAVGDTSCSSCVHRELTPDSLEVPDRGNTIRFLGPAEQLPAPFHLDGATEKLSHDQKTKQV